MQARVAFLTVVTAGAARLVHDAPAGGGGRVHRERPARRADTLACRAAWEDTERTLLQLEEWCALWRDNLDTADYTSFVIPLTQQRYDYQVVPDVHNPNGMEVYSIDEVVHEDPQTGRVTVYEPFYSYRHGDIHTDSDSDRHSDIHSNPDSNLNGCASRGLFFYSQRRPTLGPGLSQS